MHEQERARDIRRAPVSTKMSGFEDMELEEPLSPGALAHASIVNMTTTLEIQAAEYAELRRQIHRRSRLALVIITVNVVLTTILACWIGSYLTTIQSSLDSLR